MLFNFRNVLAFFVAKLLIVSGKVGRAKKMALNGDCILSIYFHDPNKKLFERCINWLQRKGFSFISVDELEAIAKGDKIFPKAAVVITVDDGWKNNKQNIVAVAERLNVPVTIFVSAEPVEKGGGYWWSYVKEAHKLGAIACSVEDLKKIANADRLKIIEELQQKINITREALTIEEVRNISIGKIVSIGSHTVTHPILTTCPDEKAFSEIQDSKKIISGWLNREVDHFAFPNGSFTAREVEMLKQAGYSMSFTTRTHYLTRFNVSERYVVPRFEIFETASFAENICRMTGVWFNKKGFSSNS